MFNHNQTVRVQTHTHTATIKMCLKYFFFLFLFLNDSSQQLADYGYYPCLDLSRFTFFSNNNIKNILKIFKYQIYKIKNHNHHS